MTIASTASLVASARARGRAVLAVNVVTVEYAEAIVAASERVGQPVILQISQNAVRYHGALGPLAAASAAAARESRTPVALHLDHVTSEALLHQAVDAGFSSAMFDAGALPYVENVARTARAAQWAHAHGLWLEAELGYVGGKEDAAASAHVDGVRTDPMEASEFVATTGVDALAVAVGSSHAMTSRTARLDHALITSLRDAVDVPLVLHGSSGAPDDELTSAVRAGVAKVNVGTALNIAFSRTVRDHGAWAESSDPRRILTAARTAMADVVAQLLRVVSV